MRLKSSQYCSLADQESQVSALNDKTTTLYSALPSLILPQDSHGNAKMFNFSNQEDDQYLHIILPTSEMNILNSNGQGVNTSSDESTFVEIGCKVFGVSQITATQAEDYNLF